MKKAAVIVFVAGLFLFSAAGSAIATANGGPNGTPPLVSYMTDSYGGMTPQTSFGWDETPWLCVELPRGITNMFIQWYEAQNDKDFYLRQSGPRNAGPMWMALIDAYPDKSAWEDVKKVGAWNVGMTAIYSGPTFISGKTSFTVTPEPISATLFLIGGVSLAVIKRKRRK